MGQKPTEEQLRQHFYAVAGLAWHDRDDEAAELHNQVSHTTSSLMKLTNRIKIMETGLEGPTLSDIT